MARPSEYNFEMCVEICNQIAENKNILNILNSNENYPSWPTFRKWKNDNNELLTLYINSQRDKAIAIESEMDDYKEMLLNKEIDASTYNVLVQTLKWKMAKFYPKMFGEKIEQDLKSSDGSISVPVFVFKNLNENETE